MKKKILGGQNKETLFETNTIRKYKNRIDSTLKNEHKAEVEFVSFWEAHFF